MRHRIAVVVFISALAAFPSTGWAGPLIIAKHVTAACVGQPGGTVTTVSVTLDNATHGFYGTQLYYHFTPTSGGPAVTLPSPTDNPNPVPEFVTAGAYSLVITNQSAPGGSSSPAYSVTIPANLYGTIGGRKICLKKVQEEPTKLINAKKAP